MKYTLPLLVLVGCVRVPEQDPKFTYKYGDIVRVKSGFYKNVIGHVYMPPMESATGHIYILRECRECRIFATIHEKDLEKYEPSR